MLNDYTHTAVTGGTNIGFLFGEEEKPKTPKFFVQNTGTLIVRDISFPSQEEGKRKVPEHSVQNINVFPEFWFEEESGSRTTQELADTQQLQLDSSYDEELLDWDVAIFTPPPRPSGTIRVKLKYKGRSKPFPVDNFWEE